jgi:elongation factor 1-alpha
MAANPKGKPHMNLVFIGHVDHGKSTTVGRVLFEAGNIDEQKLKKLKELAEQNGKAGFEFAYIMDSLKEERERGVTIDVAHKELLTNNYYFTIIDAPGHRDFVKNMITGASQADAAVLVVAADDGVNAQTREHAFLARTLGVSQMIVAINKIDKVKYDEARYEAVKKEVADLLKSVGYKIDTVPFVPVSSLMGDNIKVSSSNMSWYKGKPLLEELDLLPAPNKPTELPLRLPIENVYSITGVGVVPVGRVETGVLKIGQKIIAMPGRTGEGIKGEVKTVEMHHEQLQSAEPGDNVGFNVRGFAKNDVTRGDVIGEITNPPTVAKEFEAQIVVLNHPSVIAPGYTPVFHAYTAQVPCTITAILKKLNPKTGEVLEENPQFIKRGDVAVVKVTPRQGMVMERKADIPQLSTFAVRDSGMTVAAGMVINVVKK